MPLLITSSLSPITRTNHMMTITSVGPMPASTREKGARIPRKGPLLCSAFTTWCYNQTDRDTTFSGSRLLRFPRERGESTFPPPDEVGSIRKRQCHLAIGVGIRMMKLDFMDKICKLDRKCVQIGEVV
ncbi:hypothetical protein NPIL_339671 [Nephila pilipes]|uniref:Uncharacterized protein n=1 Tax=Nephila pilipes TaxID=299642 RepID=A0A8X6U9T7_NEPPI|nr:hypothetical protein NPIL_339671 [Nephila pilipes]